MLVPLLGVIFAGSPVSVAAPGFQAVHIDQAEANLFAELAAQELTQRGLKVLTSRDIAAVLGLERQKQLLGCTETSCIAEIAGGLGAQGLMLGDVGRIGSEYVLTVKVLDTTSGQPLALFNDKVARAEDMTPLIRRAMWRVMSQLSTALGRPDLAPKDREPGVAMKPKRPSPWWAVGFGLASVAAFSVGGVMMGLAGTQAERIRTTQDLTEAVQAAEAGAGQQTTGVVLLVTGGVLAAVGVLWAALFAGEPAEVAWLPRVSMGRLTWSLP